MNCYLLNVILESTMADQDYPVLRAYLQKQGGLKLAKDPRFINTRRDRACWINYAVSHRK